MIELLTANLSGRMKHATLEGRKCLVVPMVMLTEGVHAGSRGPVLYPGAELSNAPQVWDHKPVVVYHPQKDGEFTSACTPEEMETRKVGLILNTRFVKGKLRAEAWLDVERLNSIDERILAAIEEGKVTEVSTGLHSDLEDSPGIYNTEPYSYIAKNYKPDHLAILPDQVGACSVRKGAGLGVLNQQQKQELGDLIKSAVLAANKELSTKEPNMAKKELIDQLITNGGYEEADRPVLEKFEDAKLTKLVEKVTIANTKTETPPQNDTEKKPGEGDINTPITNAVVPPVKGAEEKKLVTAAEYLANNASDMPPEIRDMLGAGLMIHNQQKNDCIGVILANKKNNFTKEFLETQQLPYLQAMAALAGNEEPKQVVTPFTANFLAQGGGVPGGTIATEHKEEPLPVPTF